MRSSISSSVFISGHYTLGPFSFWAELELAVPAAEATFFSLIPNSTFSTARLKVVIVKPLRSKIRGSHPSGMRSSTRRGSRSCSRPPNIVSNVEELISYRCSNVTHHKMWQGTYFALPKNLWNTPRENSGFFALDSARRTEDIRERSAGVRRTFPSLSFPVADSRSSLTYGRWGTP